MHERIIDETNLVRGKYPSLVHGNNYDWVMIPDYILPAGYNRERTRLLFLIPNSYPHSAPDSFYVDKGLCLGNSNQIPNYSEGNNIPVPGEWGCFSWHPQVWKPSDSIQMGDNLISFLRSVNLRLRGDDQ